LNQPIDRKYLLKFDLTEVLQRSLNFVFEEFDLLRSALAGLVNLAIFLKQLMSNVESRHHRNFLKPVNRATRLDFSHVFIKMAGGFEQGILLRGRTTDLVFTIQYFDNNRAGGFQGIAHIKRSGIVPLIAGDSARIQDAPWPDGCSPAVAGVPFASYAAQP
jgi:hypothetical protein